MPAMNRPDEQQDYSEDCKKEEDEHLPMHKHIAIAALAVEFSALSAVALFLIAALVGQPALNFA
jgi:hypothetical protein